jgi:hypothetical protein
MAAAACSSASALVDATPTTVTPWHSSRHRGTGTSSASEVRVATVPPANQRGTPTTGGGRAVVPASG